MKALGLLMSAVIGYALGSISTGILVGRLFGIKDIRNTASGSSGTTNVIRSAGFGPGILTLLGDFFKGYAAALAGRALFGSAGMLVGGIAAIAGHDFPVFFGFRGGKGIITSLGVIAVISPRLALFQFALQIVIVLITKYMSAGAIANMAALPFVIVGIEAKIAEIDTAENGAEQARQDLVKAMLAIDRAREQVEALVVTAPISGF